MKKKINQIQLDKEKPLHHGSLIEEVESVQIQI